MTAAKERQSVWIVLALTAIALLLGWLVKDMAAGDTRSIQIDGLTASLPEQWLIARNTAGQLERSASSDTSLLFSAWDPLSPATRYSVSLLPSGSDGSLAASAAIRNLQRAQNLTAYRILEQTLVSLRGRDGYKVSYAYVDASAVDEVPMVYRGVDYYFFEGQQIIVATLESSQNWEQVLLAFQDFAASVGKEE